MDFLKNTKTNEYSVISNSTILLFPLHSTDFTDGTMPETPQLMSSKNGFENSVKNKDGSIDIFFGPTKPAGVVTTNWIPTVKGKA
jgi:hypothetical protein